MWIVNLNARKAESAGLCDGEGDSWLKPVNVSLLVVWAFIMYICEVYIRCLELWAVGRLWASINRRFER